MRESTTLGRVVTSLVCGSVLLVPNVGFVAEAQSEVADSGWLDTVQADLAEREYHVTWQADLAGAWHAPNRAQGFRTYFTEGGIRVVPRIAETQAWEWGLSWIGYGRGGRSWKVSAATLAQEENRIAYRRGALQEFYENSARGLKQSFVLAVPPEELAASIGAPATAPLHANDTAELVHLDLALGGNLSPVFFEGGQAVDFVTAAGVHALRYSELRVTDARGLELRAWIEGFSSEGVRGIRLVLDTRDAVWPVTIDPLTTSPVWTAEGDQVGAQFGISVATAGDVNGDGYADVIIGADRYDNGQTDEGRAFAYHGSAAGLAMSPAWTAESDQANANFGYSVATAGDVNGDGYSDVIVGAYSYDNGQTNEGRANVYYGSAAGLATSPTWTAEGDQADAYLGVEVAAAGDANGDGYADVIVGAHGYDNGQTNEGRVFAYNGSAAGLSTSPDWTAESDQVNAYFGLEVGTAGDVNGDGYTEVIIGAPYYDGGRAFVYHGSQSGLLASLSWTAESDMAGAFFGWSLATAGDVNGDGYADVIVGAHHYDNGQTNEGRAYVYHGSAAGLSTSPAWAAEGDEEGALFGVSVATAGDVNGDGYADVVIGAWLQAADGRAFVYHGSAAGLGPNSSWTAEGDQVEAFFGSSVATAGDVNGDGYADVLVGGPHYNNGQTDEGRAFVYHGSASGLGTTPGWVVESDRTLSELGGAVATAGDVNGDGYSDVIVGSYFYDNGQADEGRSFVYHGSIVGLATTAAWTAESDQASAYFGGSIATVGDVNGDGYSDIIVGADAYDNGEGDEGRAFVYHGSASGLATTAAWTAESDQASALFGTSVATAGDVNGDGYSDAIVGAYLYDNGQTNEGRTFVYYGSASGLATTAAWTGESDQMHAGFGNSVATAGDVNRDGHSDVIITAYNYDNDQIDEGRAFVYHGSVSGLATQASWTAEGDQADAHFGVSAATAGDVDGDGYADVIVGAYLYDNGQVDEGRAFVYHGSAAGLEITWAWAVESDQEGSQFGYSGATAGDVNGDGYSDVVVGAYSYDNGQPNEGRAFIYHGSAAGLATSPSWTAESDDANSEFGRSVASAGDVNGDGYADVLVGAPRYDNGQVEEGRAFLYYGNGGAGLNLNPRQRRTDDAGPIAHLGASDSLDSFRLNLVGHSPFGRGRVRLEWEVKPLGVGFDGLNTEFSAQAHDTGTSGVELSELATGLIDASPYHWRVRLRYDSVTTPLAQHSCWVTMPWKGWQETMLRTAAPPSAGFVSDGSTGTPLLLDEASGGMITLAWGASCVATDTNYAIYEGALGDFESHAARFCSTSGATTMTFTPLVGDTYYLVVPLNAFREGSYGTDSNDIERPQGLNACLPQQIAACL